MHCFLIVDSNIFQYWMWLAVSEIKNKTSAPKIFVGKHHTATAFSIFAALLWETIENCISESLNIKMYCKRLVVIIKNNPVLKQIRLQKKCVRIPNNRRHISAIESSLFSEGRATIFSPS